jgi:hypothetical protein
MSKYVHPNWGKDKHYYVGSNGFTYYVKEYRKGVFTTELSIGTIEQFNTFLNRLESNGWKNADAS